VPGHHPVSVGPIDSKRCEVRLRPIGRRVVRGRGREQRALTEPTAASPSAESIIIVIERYKHHVHLLLHIFAHTNPFILRTTWVPCRSSSPRQRGPANRAPGKITAETDQSWDQSAVSRLSATAPIGYSGLCMGRHPHVGRWLPEPCPAARQSQDVLHNTSPILIKIPSNSSSSVLHLSWDRVNCIHESG